jgi:hypothetical protein
MIKVPIEILILDSSNLISAKQAIAFLNKVQDTFEFSVLDYIVKSQNDKTLNTEDVYQLIGVVQSEMRGYHPHIICVIDKFLIGDRLSNLFAGLDRKNGSLTGKGVITSYQVTDLFPALPIDNGSY